MNFSFNSQDFENNAQTIHPNDSFLSGYLYHRSNNTYIREHKLYNFNLHFEKLIHIGNTLFEFFNFCH